MTPSPLSARILDRAQRAGLSIEPADLEKLERYYLLLQRWNSTINLTGLPLANYPDATLDRLVIEPLLAASDVADSPLNWIDFGSGGGSPAVPLKIVRPQAALTMVEAKARKAAFLREITSTLALSATTVLTSRVEDLGSTELRGMADVVTVRAVKVDDLFLGSVAAVLKLGGRLIIFRSRMPLVFNDFRFVSVAEAALEPLQAGLTILEKRA